MSSTGFAPILESIDSAVGVRRFANDSIRNAVRRFDAFQPSVFEFLCECGDLRCRELVMLTLAEYDGIEPREVRAH